MKKWTVQGLKSMLCLLLLCAEANGQYFGRNSVQLPSVGWMGMDTSLGALNESDWGIFDQFQIGTGYARDLQGRKLWWLNETILGFARVNNPDSPSSRIAIMVQGSTGIRYNLLLDYWRPFVAGLVGIHQIFNTPNHVPPFEMVSPTWATFQPMIGLEYMFAADMGLEGQLGYVVLVNFYDPARHSATGRFSYRIYF